MAEGNKIKSFKDLFAWQIGHVIVLEIYKITNEFPKKELFCLVNQMRRAAISITSNIVEDFGRNGSKEKTQFYKIGLGSLFELHNQLIILLIIFLTRYSVISRIRLLEKIKLFAV